MNNKYELIQTDFKINIFGIKVFRIKAKTKIVQYGVNKGDLGGYVASEKNLSTYGDAWVNGNAWVFGDAQVYGNAQVFGNARVCGDAQVYGNARVCGDAQVFGNARVCGDALVYGNALVFSNAQVCGDALVYGNARVCGDAQVFGNARVEKKSTIVMGIKHNITVTETHIFIGCEGHSIEHWKKNIFKIGRKQNYSDIEIRLTIQLLKVLLKMRSAR